MLKRRYGTHFGGVQGDADRRMTFICQQGVRRLLRCYFVLAITIKTRKTLVSYRDISDEQLQAGLCAT